MLLYNVPVIVNDKKAQYGPLCWFFAAQMVINFHNDNGSQNKLLRKLSLVIDILIFRSKVLNQNPYSKSKLNDFKSDIGGILKQYTEWVKSGRNPSFSVSRLVHQGLSSNDRTNQEAVAQVLRVAIAAAAQRTNTALDDKLTENAVKALKLLITNMGCNARYLTTEDAVQAIDRAAVDAQRSLNSSLLNLGKSLLKELIGIPNNGIFALGGATPNYTGYVGTSSAPTESELGEAAKVLQENDYINLLLNDRSEFLKKFTGAFEKASKDSGFFASFKEDDVTAMFSDIAKLEDALMQFGPLHCGGFLFPISMHKNRANNPKETGSYLVGSTMRTGVPFSVNTTALGLCRQ